MKNLINKNVYSILDVKMIKAEYNPETDMLRVTMTYPEENRELSDVVNFKDFMDSIGAQRSRIEYILAEIDEIKHKRVLKTDDFIGVVGDIMKKQKEVRDAMEKATMSGNFKLVAALQKVHKALLDEKNTYREIRYAIKLLEIDEARLKTEMLKMLA